MGLNMLIFSGERISMIIFRNLIFIGLIGLTSCLAGRTRATDPSLSCNDYLQILPDSISCEPNQDSTYYLCQDRVILKSHSIYPDRINSLSIIRCRDGEVILKEDIRGGSATWADAENVKVFYPSGIPKEASETTYYFNINSGKKSKSGLKSR